MFGYFFYLPKTKPVISTTNYNIPNFLINLYVSSEEPNMMDKFTEAPTRKIGDPNDISGNQRDTVEAFKDHSETLNKRDLEEFNDDRCIQDDMSDDIKQDFVTTDNISGINSADLTENIPDDVEKIGRKDCLM